VFPQADHCFILVEDKGGRLLPTVVKARRPQDEVNARFNGDLVRTCLETGRAVLTGNAEGERRVRSAMCAPLRPAGGAFGAVQLDTEDRGKRFRDGDLKVLADLIRQANIALEIALRHRDAQAEADKRDLELGRAVRTICLPEAVPQVPGYEF